MHNCQASEEEFYVKTKHSKKKMCNISEKTASVDFSIHIVSFVKAGQN